MKMKKLVVSLALAALMFVSPAMAEVMYQSDYFNNGAVEMQYMQTQLPVQTYIQGADFVATDVFTASADLVVLQALPQNQKMSGTANGGYSTSSWDSGYSGNTYDSRTLIVDAAVAISENYANVQLYPYNYSGQIYANAQDQYYYWDGYYNDGGINVAAAASLYYNEYVQDYYSSYFGSYNYSTLPASGEMGATQTAMNQTVLQTPNMFLQMTQVASQGGFLNMTGHGNQNGYCD